MPSNLTPNDVLITNGFTHKGKEIAHKAICNYTAHLAEKIVCHCSMVVGDADGEDTAGRQKPKLLSAVETAKRAVDIAVAMTNEFQKRGMFIDLGEYEPREKP